MKPVKFKEVNVTYAENQPEYLPLPVFKGGAPDYSVVSCWQLSFKERLRLLFTGKLWISMMTFGGNLQPILPSTNKSDVLITKK